MNAKLTVAAATVASFMGLGTFLYLASLVHADQHTEDRQKISDVIIAQATMQTILNTQLLGDELIRARDLRRRIESNPTDSELEADMLIKTELHIEQLRQAVTMTPNT